jgi:hypothetical protein
VSRPNLRYRLSSGSAGGRDAAGIATVFWAPTKSTVNPEIKIETARKVMVRDLCRVFIILGPPSMVANKNDVQNKYHN